MSLADSWQWPVLWASHEPPVAQSGALAGPLRPDDGAHAQRKDDGDGRDHDDVDGTHMDASPRGEIHGAAG